MQKTSVHIASTLDAGSIPAISIAYFAGMLDANGSFKKQTGSTNPRFKSMKHVWQCETCDATHAHWDSIWDCPDCKEETCESCFDRYAHCKTCGYNMSDEDLRENANVAGWEFE